ncbi:MAG: hypothetical protein LBQ61_08825 [Spirochaetales bacterium]|jgi:plasmid stabilization system protein ParE|nr:hypothetical protein [Spirochaetales bacterium]
MYFVDITDIAENDILVSADYITNVLKAPIAANNLLDELERVEHILAETPYIYPKLNQASLWTTRTEKSG